jgi:hypothetical protein
MSDRELKTANKIRNIPNRYIYIYQDPTRTLKCMRLRSCARNCSFKCEVFTMSIGIGQTNECAGYNKGDTEVQEAKKRNLSGNFSGKVASSAVLST